MNFSFSSEQEMLRESARSYLAKSHPPERVAELAQSEAGWDESSWEEIAGLGWTSLSISESEGGAGMGFLEEAVIFEETGYGLYPGPYLSTVGLALPALKGPIVGEVASGEARVGFAWAEDGGPVSLGETSGLSTKAVRSGDGWELTGEKILVADPGAIENAVVLAAGPDGPGLFLARDVECTTLSTVDSTRRLGTLSLSGHAAEELAGGDDVAAVLATIKLRGYVALALEAVGIAQKALELAQEHVKTREQFGKPIGTYQAVSHQVSDTYVDTELSRSLAYWAAWCVAEGDANAEKAALAAKARAAEAAVTACERSIQVHGGIGFTWEHILHRYYKRAEWISSFDGPSASARSGLVAALLAD